MRARYIIGVFLLALDGHLFASSLTSPTCSEADVRATVATCQGTSGCNEVDLPVCEVTWAHSAWVDGVALSGDIWLKGAGIDQTIIHNGLAADGPLVLVDAGARISHLTMANGGGTGSGGRGTIALYHASKVDYIKFDYIYGFNVVGYDAVGGVIDNNIFHGSSAGGIAIYIFNANWGSRQTTGQKFGDESFYDPPLLGTNNALFIENNTFAWDAPGTGAVTDAYQGARFVVRYNEITNGNVLSHGTESSGRFRGVRTIEVYENQFYGAASANWAVEYRSGTGVVFNNQSEQAYIVRAEADRMEGAFDPFGGASGVNPWDLNDTSVAATAYTVSNFVINGEWRTVTVSPDPAWTTNQWVDYNVYDSTKDGVTDPLGTPCGGASSGTRIQIPYGHVISNDSNSVTYYGFSVNNCEAGVYFSSGDTFRFTRVLHSLDQPGRGQGGLVDNNNANPPPWGTGLAANDQVDEPIYQWNNFKNGTVAWVFSTDWGQVSSEVVNGEKPGYTPYTYPHPNALPTLPPDPFGPINRAPPVVTGTATVGQVLTTTLGTWNGYPAVATAVHWKDCPELTPNTCTDIPGATATTYTLALPQNGKVVRACVDATNSNGSLDVCSDATLTVTRPGAGNLVVNNSFEVNDPASCLDAVGCSTVPTWTPWVTSGTAASNQLVISSVAQSGARGVHFIGAADASGTIRQSFFLQSSHPYLWTWWQKNFNVGHGIYAAIEKPGGGYFCGPLDNSETTSGSFEFVVAGFISPDDSGNSATVMYSAHDLGGGYEAYLDNVSITTVPFAHDANLANFALQANGATATATSQFDHAGLSPITSNDGDRSGDPAGYEILWNSAPSGHFPDTLEIDFNASRAIGEIDVYTLGDCYPTCGDDPAAGDTATTYGIKDFDVEYWNGAAWIPIANVAGNTLQWRKFTFPAVTTTKIHVVVHDSNDHQYSRIAEVEAYAPAVLPPQFFHKAVMFF